MCTYVTKRPQNCTKMLTKIQKTTWERLQADVKRTTTQTGFFVISKVKVLLKRPQRDKKVIFLNTVTMATRCCSDLQQRRDVTWTTWRTLTFSLCKTVNCVCSQTPVKHRQAEVQRFDLWNVTVQARRTKPTKQSWSGAHNPPPSRLFLNTDSSHRSFIFYYPSSLWLLFSSRSGWLTPRFSPHPDRCDKLTYLSLTLADSSLWPVPAGKEGERCDPRIGSSVTDPQQLLAAHTELRLLFWSLKTLLRTAGPATHCSTYLCRAAWKREHGSSHSFHWKRVKAAFWLQAQNIFFISSVMDSFHCDLMSVTSITLQNSYSESDKKKSVALA